MSVDLEQEKIMTTPEQNIAPLVFSHQETDAGQAQIVKVDTALESWRDAGFDLTAAVGEVVDNSVEAAATRIRIKTYPEGNAVKKIDSIAFADNGIGIDPTILANVLSLGFSTRYNQRNGLGRFGVGLKLAALSHAQRLEIYTKVDNGPGVWRAFLDLEMVSAQEQKVITREQLESFPSEYADLMTDAEGQPLPSGTLVVWSKVDRLESGGKFKTDLKQRLAELQKFLARAYRRFIDKGVEIELNSRVITLHDPTFQLENPRLTDRLKRDVRGELISRDVIKVDGHEVVVTVAMAPEELNEGRGKGDSQIAKDFHIPENEGKVSFLRQGREINYEFPPYTLPKGEKWGDRYIGIEVEFPAALDEYFQVRHVKRGVMPVDKLRQELRKALERPLTAARKRYQDRWNELEQAERKIGEDHSVAMKTVAKVEETAPRGRAGTQLTTAEADQKVSDVIEQLQLDPVTEPDKIEKLRESIRQLPISVADTTWPGKELFDITHLNGKAILKLNHGHPLLREVYDPIHEAIDNSVSDIEPAEAMRLLRRAEVGIMLLLMAYAKAENMDREPDMNFSELRMHWGQSTAAYLNAALKDLP
ncbi:ATP-binding protein [Actinosynnema sp. CA-248983]